MTANELMRILNAVDNDTEVLLSIGDSDREKCAKAELVSSNCLEYLRIGHAEVYKDIDGLWVNLVLVQDGVSDLDGVAKAFDELYQRIEDES